MKAKVLRRSLEDVTVVLSGKIRTPSRTWKGECPALGFQNSFLQ